MEKNGCFFQEKSFSQPSLNIVKEMTTLDTILAHPYSMAQGWKRSDVSSSVTPNRSSVPSVKMVRQKTFIFI
jgi:hypothetical protein